MSRAAAPAVGPPTAAAVVVGVAACSASRAWMPETVRSGSSRMNQMSTKPIATTQAATRNTRSIESANPTRNGSARRGSMRCRTEESCTTCAAPVTGFSATALAGLAATTGSAAAAWNAGVPTAAANAVRMLSPTVENRIDRKTATPSVPPICRKNVADAVATPMSLAGTAFCTASTRVCMHRPTPSPKIAMRTATSP